MAKQVKEQINEQPTTDQEPETVLIPIHSYLDNGRKIRLAGPYAATAFEVACRKHKVFHLKTESEWDALFDKFMSSGHSSEAFK